MRTGTEDAGQIVWIDEGQVEAGPQSRRGFEVAGSPGEFDLDEPAFEAAVGSDKARRLRRRLSRAARAFQEERFADARQILVGLVEEVPNAVSALELLGLSSYGLGRWEDAIEELSRFATLTGTTEQHPVLADCHRALGNYDRMDAVWRELKEASPSAELVSECRVVVASSLADRDRLDDGIRLLDPNWRLPKRPEQHHLRRLYCLADLLERAGDVPGARRRFEVIDRADSGFLDVRRRISALS